jgi:hypothetical protein
MPLWAIMEQRRDILALHDRTGLLTAALTRLLAVRDWDSGAVLREFDTFQEHATNLSTPVG